MNSSSEFTTGMTFCGKLSTCVMSKGHRLSSAASYLIVIPVMDATHVKLKLIVVSQQSLLDMDEVHWLAVDKYEPHAPLERKRRVPTARAHWGRGTT